MKVAYAYPGGTKAVAALDFREARLSGHLANNAGLNEPIAPAVAHAENNHVS